MDSLSGPSIVIDGYESFALRLENTTVKATGPYDKFGDNQTVSSESIAMVLGTNTYLTLGDQANVNGDILFLEKALDTARLNFSTVELQGTGRYSGQIYNQSSVSQPVNVILKSSSGSNWTFTQDNSFSDIEIQGNLTADGGLLQSRGSVSIQGGQLTVGSGSSLVALRSIVIEGLQGRNGL
jgi:adhesin HecA-like repeat protein